MFKQCCGGASAAALVLVGLLTMAAPPAQACGCGAYLPREGEAHVAEERALIRWDGQTEDIVMELSVVGRSKEAAWILPVPAHAPVQLSDPRLFDALQELTKPAVREQKVGPRDAMTGGAPTGGAPPVTLLERQALGPFDVSTLAATDATALATWLTSNGYQFPEQLGNVLTPYVKQQWFYVAVRLTPAQSGGALAGKLDPLWVTFASDKIIYPMRASALARDPLPVFLYVLAAHRAGDPDRWYDSDEPAEPRPSFVKFANWVAPTSLPKDSPLAPFVTHTLFLTKFDIYIGNPAAISNDLVFPLAARDETYRDTELRYVYDPNYDSSKATLRELGGIGLLVLVALGGLFAMAWTARWWKLRHH